MDKLTDYIKTTETLNTKYYKNLLCAIENAYKTGSNSITGLLIAKAIFEDIIVNQNIATGGLYGQDH